MDWRAVLTQCTWITNITVKVVTNMKYHEKFGSIKLVLPPFFFICHVLVQKWTSGRQIFEIECSITFQMAFFCIYLFRGLSYSHCSILWLLQIYYYSIRQQCGHPQGAPCPRPPSATPTATQDSRFPVHVQSKPFLFILNIAEDYIHVFFFPDYL